MGASSYGARGGEAGACSTGSNDGENRRGAPSPDRRKGRAGSTTSGRDACSDANGDASSDANASGDDGSSDVSCYARGGTNGWFNVNTNGHGLWCYADGKFWRFASNAMAAVRGAMIYFIDSKSIDNV